MHDSAAIRTPDGARAAPTVGAGRDEVDGSSPLELPLLLNIDQATTMLSISKTTLYGLVCAGEIETVHIGRAVRYPRVALEDYVARLVGRAHDA
jgi:excisionase family DNA binding protein